MTCQLQLRAQRPAKETEASKLMPVVDTPAINPEPDVTPTPQHPFMQDSNPPTLLPKKTERRYPLRDRKTISEMLLNRFERLDKTLIFRHLFATVSYISLLIF